MAYRKSRIPGTRALAVPKQQTALAMLAGTYCDELAKLPNDEARLLALADRLKPLDLAQRLEILRGVQSCTFWSQASRESMARYVRDTTSRNPATPGFNPTNPATPGFTSRRPANPNPPKTQEPKTMNPTGDCHCNTDTSTTTTSGDYYVDACGRVNTPDVAPPILTRECGQCSVATPRGIIVEPKAVVVPISGTITVIVKPSSDGYFIGLTVSQGGGITNANKLFISNWAVEGVQQMFPLPAAGAVPAGDPNLVLVPITQWIEGMGPNATAGMWRKQAFFPGPVALERLNTQKSASFVITNTDTAAQTVTFFQWINYVGQK